MNSNRSLQEWFTSEIEALKDDPEFILEGALLQFTDKISLEMERQGMSKSDLARKIGKKPPFITRVLRGNSNITLATMVQILTALGLKFDFNFLHVTEDAARLTTSKKEPQKSQKPDKQKKRHKENRNIILS